MSEFYDDYEDEFGEEDISEFEENTEPEKQVKKKDKKGRFTFDFFLGVAGVFLAVSSAFFPWYVFVNQEKFSVKEMAYGDDRILPSTWQGRSVVNVSPQAIPGRDLGIQNAPLPPDEITTASIPDAQADSSIDTDEEGTSISEARSSPFNPTYRLLHVVNGRALIEDISGTYIMKVGSVLPDNSRIAALEERNNGWVLITSDGGILEN